MFIVFYCISSKVCQGLTWWFLGVYKVQGQTQEEFVATVVQVEMQRRHLYTARYAAKVVNAAAAYRAKHEIIDTDMGQGFTLYSQLGFVALLFFGLPNFEF